MADKEIRVVFADDHAMVRQALAAMVAGNPAIKVVGQCGDGLRVVDIVRQTRPDVVVLDIGMPGLNGLDVCRQLSRKVPGVAILMLTMHDDEQYVAKALQYGASGYLLKESAAGQLVEAILTVARGELFLKSGVTKRAFKRMASGASDPYESLTPRERQVLQQIAEGNTSRQIALVFGLSVKTVDTHRSNLMRKLDIHDQVALAKYAMRRGIVSLE